MSDLVQKCPAIGRICPVRIDPLGKMLINYVLLVETLSNLTQGYSNTLGTTYSRIMTCIVGYESRSQKLEIETYSSNRQDMKYDSRLDSMQDNDILVVLQGKDI
jgi:hypothetical protein